MSRYEEVDLTRDCTVVQVPQGNSIVLEAGTPAVITQALGDSYTIQVPTLGGLYRVAAADADALGKSDRRAAAAAAAALVNEGRPVTEDLLREALRDVYDPEIPISIIDLGLIYELQVGPHPDGGSAVFVRMTLTAPGCGMGQIIAQDAKQRLESLPGVTSATVDVVWEPPWGPHRISAAGRAKLGLE